MMIANPEKLKWVGWATLILVLVLGLVVRLLELTDPPLDFHPVRQLRSAAIARGLYYEQDLRTDAQMRVQAVGVMPVDVHEPPINEQIAAGLYMLVGGEKLWIARLLSILYWMIGGWALFSIGRQVLAFWPALLGLLYYMALPFAVIASRAFMPDPGMVMWVLLAAWAGLRWSHHPGWKNAALMGGLAGVGILWKVTAGFFIGPMLVLLVLNRMGMKGWLRSGKVWLAVVLALFPAVFYYLVLHGGRAGEYFTYNTMDMLGMLQTSKFYAQWLAMADGLVSLSMVLLGLVGLVVSSGKYKALLGGLWIGYAAYGLAWPFQYTTHEYYHLSLVPILGLSLMPLAQVVLNAVKGQNRLWRAALVVIILAAAGYQLWVGRSMLVGGDLSTEPRSWQLVGEAIPKNSSFIALTNDYGVRLEYYGMRKAGFYWPGSNDLGVAQLRGQPVTDWVKTFKNYTQGYTYFLVTALGELEKQPELKKILVETYPIYHQGAGFMIYDLSKPLKPLP